LSYSEISLIRCVLFGFAAPRTRPVLWSPRSQWLKGLREIPHEGGIRLSMLPGFRFLLAAIVFSMSILVFGLGAAALLRAAHEQFASNPSWRGAPETMFAQRGETSPPVLAMLRVEPAPVAQKPDNVPAASLPAEPAAVVAALPEQAAVSASAESEQITALTPKDSSPPETAKPETPAAENPAPGEAAPAQADAPAPAEQARIAATEQSLPAANEAVAAASEPISAPASPETGIAETKIATLGGPAVAIETPLAKAASAKPERDVIKKRQQARRAAQRRRLAARARVAQQPPAGPFGEPAAQPVTPVRTR
jgi:hypothetical protein